MTAAVSGSIARIPASSSSPSTQERKIASYSAALLGKCLKISASETPAAWAISFVVVAVNPLRANRGRAASMIAAHRSVFPSRRMITLVHK